MIVAGLGFRRAATADSLADALARAAGERTVHALATLEDKGQGLRPFADMHGIPLTLVTQADAATQDTLTRSAASMAAKGLHSVAEACALAAAGPGARLLAPRTISKDGQATCAIAERTET